MGQRAFVDGRTREARQCVPNLSGSCPNNYLCIFNPVLRLYFCCGTVKSGEETSSAMQTLHLLQFSSAVCPHNAAAYTDRTTNQPLACTLNVVDVCPTGYSCQSTAATQGLYGYCCAGIVPQRMLNLLLLPCAMVVKEALL